MSKAKSKDFKSLYSILLDCSNWLKKRNIPLWENPYPKEKFLKEIKNGEVYYFKEDNEILGTVTLYENKPSYYPENLWNDSINARYICRLAVPRKKTGNKFGELILKKIEEEAKKNNIKELRLDVIKANKFLKLYYSKVGYKNILLGKTKFGEDTIFMVKKI